MPKKLKISGPGAADFLTAPGGTDFPETDTSKGATQATRGEGLLDNAEDLEPDLEAPDPALQREGEVTPPDRGGRRNG
jgi:hypothetical protein